MSEMTKTVPATLTRQGEQLVGDLNGRGVRAVPPREWDASLTAHATTMADGDTVAVEAVTDLLNSGKRTVRLAGAAAVRPVRTDPAHTKAVARGGFVNPYTFVPTPPRDGLDGTGMEDHEPPSHAHVVAGQWSGTLALTLTTVTPLLLPVQVASDGVKTFETRVGADNLPVLHGASLKGALRSAFETVTASRYGVFADHDDRLAHRAPASSALSLVPARVCRDGDQAWFQLCQGDEEWTRHSKVQAAAWVPAYQGSPRLIRGADLSRGPLTNHHGESVWARVVLCQYQRGNGGFHLWRATHLARTREQLDAVVRDRRGDTGRLRPVDGVAARIVRGWLSATGHSIQSKHDERLFVPSDGQTVPLTEAHVSYWASVLRAYDLAHGYNDPMATYCAAEVDPDGVERSRHVPSTPELRTLPDGALVYVRLGAGDEITEVHPVMIGRHPYSLPPRDLLPPSLRPASRREELSAADRLFGWVPPAGRADESASGYRGRLRVQTITCTTPDWRPAAFPAGGVTLAPLSSPKPTQFRFYAASGDDGQPIRRGAEKKEGYRAGGGLRGRKVYRWRAEEESYWQPPADQGDSDRPYLAMDVIRGSHDSQLVRHRSWVRAGATFEVRLFLDAVPEAELGALLWLLTTSTTAPLRLGAGKPYGFGVVTARLDPAATRLWDGAAVRAGWLGLSRPPSADPARLDELAAAFATTARGNPVLSEATESYKAATAPVSERVHYPRVGSSPEPEGYRWFVKNEKRSGQQNEQGWSLPHVRGPEQRLPYLDETTGSPPPREPGSPSPGTGKPNSGRSTNNRGRRGSAPP